MNQTYRFAAFSHPNQPGGQAKNEDAFLAVAGIQQGQIEFVGEIDAAMPRLFAVSDGIHCSPGAARASRLLLKDLEALWITNTEQHPSVRTARLHERFGSHSQQHPNWAGMTATLVAAELRQNQALVYHVGDSSAWLVRDGVARRLTRSHTILERMIEEGEISAEESSHLSSIYQGLDRYFTAHPAEEKPRHDQASLELLPGDTLMLASDGIDVLSPEQIVAAISSDLEQSTQELFEAAVHAGSDDNITILLIRWMETATKGK